MFIEDNDYLDKYDIHEYFRVLQQHNLVYNYNFLYFSNKSINSGIVDYNHPDGWLYKDTGPGAKISLDLDSCRIVTSSDNNSIMTFKQALHEFPRWESMLLGKIVTARFHMVLSANCNVSVILSDGISSSEKSLNLGGDVVLELQLEINSNAKELFITVQSMSNSAVLSISKIYANVGTIAIENLPCIVKGIIGERKQYISTQNPPAEELSLCNKPIELNSSQTRLHSVLNKRFGVGKNNFSMLPDVRGYFSRSWNNNSSIDKDASTRVMFGNNKCKGDYVGTSENDVFTKHCHELKYSNEQIMSPVNGSPATGLNLTKTSDTQPIGGKETRPINFAELYTIKWA